MREAPVTHKPKSYQFDLFANQANDEAAKTPRWPKLPAPTRQTLTTLMTRLILDHASQDGGQSKGGGA